MKYSIGLGLALAFCSVEAWGDNTAVAEALFDSGRQLFDEGKYAQACEKFAESQRLDPGTGTLLNLASCYEKDGKLASAWATYRLAASSAAAAGQSDRESHARRTAADLEARLARITITVSDTAKVEGLVIRRNDEEQSSAVWGVAIPVDAGAHRIEAEAPGHRPSILEVTIDDGEAKTIEIPALESGAPSPEEEPPPSNGTERSEEEAPPVDVAPSRSPNLRTWGYVLSGAGVVGLGVGSYFGFRALEKNRDSEEECVVNRCTRDGVDLRDQAIVSGNLSTVFVGVGLAALGGGVTLLVLAPERSRQVGISPRPGGATLIIQGDL